MIRARFSVAVVSTVIALAPLGLPFTTGEAAAAGPSRCGGAKDSTQSWALVNVDCTRGDGGGGKVKNPIYRTIKRYPERGTCKDANGRDSIWGLIWDPILKQSYDWCLLQAGGGNVVDKTTLKIEAPKPTADFGDRFLTGAEVTFTVPEMTSYIQSLQQFPNASVTATPVKMAWDFGDGTTSAELEPKHTFLTKTPNPAKPDDHSVHVTVTGTWHLYLHPADEGPGNPVQDLGEVALTGQLDRPIVEVWAAQTEPKTNA